jgi:adenine deaminase
MVRHSSIRSDLEELGPAINTLPNDSIILVSDGIFADDLMFRGYMDHIVAEAIRFGLEPRHAIRMATINPARYFRVDSEVGSLTPGRIADVLLLESLDRPVPVKVFERGTLAAEAGALTRRPSPELEVGVEFYPYAFSSVEASEFIVERPDVETVPVIDIIDRTVTRRMDVALPRDGNIILPDRKGDVRKIVYSAGSRRSGVRVPPWFRGGLRGHCLHGGPRDARPSRPRLQRR